jgi:hypothetical protein
MTVTRTRLNHSDRKLTLLLVNSGTQNINGEIYFVKKDDWVQVNIGLLTHDSSAIATTAVVIPEEFRPSGDISELYRNETDVVTLCSLNATGVLSFAYRNLNTASATARTSTARELSISYKIR